MFFEPVPAFVFWLSCAVWLSTFLLSWWIDFAKRGKLLTQLNECNKQLREWKADNGKLEFDLVTAKQQRDLNASLIRELETRNREIVDGATANEAALRRELTGANARYLELEKLYKEACAKLDQSRTGHAPTIVDCRGLSDDVDAAKGAEFGEFIPLEESIIHRDENRRLSAELETERAKVATLQEQKAALRSECNNVCEEAKSLHRELLAARAAALHARAILAPPDDPADAAAPAVRPLFPRMFPFADIADLPADWLKNAAILACAAAAVYAGFFKKAPVPQPPPQPFEVRKSTEYATADGVRKLSERVDRLDQELRELDTDITKKLDQTIKDITAAGEHRAESIHKRLDPIIQAVGKIEEISRLVHEVNNRAKSTRA